MISIIKKIYLRIVYIFLKKQLSSSSGKFILFGKITIESPSNVILGKGVTLNDGVYISGHGEVVIEPYVSLSAGCKIITASLIPEKINKKSKENIHTSSPVYIGENSQIGAGAIILPGVTIGSNSIIGAGSVVTKNVPSGMIYAGNPAKFIRKINFSY
ncbi:acyltransferase [Aliivibrio fischeri]|uniref:acyltransferase n=1 Tax=Aliivibrio fischeri TaxID=668 RepID=UPI003221F118|nr:acyltransferase [Aliivibrio fischeri]